jgi:hypothetical protein
MLTDISGKVLYQNNILLRKTDVNKLQFEKALSKGIYILQIRLNDNLISKRLMCY